MPYATSTPTFGAYVVRREESGTMSRLASTDEQLLGRLLAPPALDDGVEALDFSEPAKPAAAVVPATRAA